MRGEILSNGNFFVDEKAGILNEIFFLRCGNSDWKAGVGFCELGEFFAFFGYPGTVHKVLMFIFEALKLFREIIKFSDFGG